MVEQACVYHDLDGVDPHCHHLWTCDASGAVAAYLRIVPPGAVYGEPSLGRIITSPRARGTGLGVRLVERGIVELESLYGPSPVRIAAQRYLVDFYRRFGFERTGHDFDEDGIPHSEMLRTIRTASVHPGFG